MDDLLTEREQVERIRRWWKENGAWIIVGVGGGILALVSWNWWQGYKLERAEQASAIYSVVAEAAMEGRLEEVRMGVERLASGHARSPYLQHGRLALAGVKVRLGEMAGAIAQLEQVVAGARDPQLALIARLRLARLLAAEGEHERVLSLVRGVDGGAFAAPFAEIEGDVLAARGDIEAAREAYGRALQSAGQLGAVIDEEFVRLKLEALAPAPGGEAS